MIEVKAIRHARIKDIIEHTAIKTQEDLADALRNLNIEVTQATVSRDIKELMLVKIPIGDGQYRYAFPMEKNLVFSKNRMTRMFQDSVIGMDYSENIIIIKTLPGTANAVAATLDYARWPEIIGTVAGDDNILVVVKPAKMVPQVLRKLELLNS